MSPRFIWAQLRALDEKSRTAFIVSGVTVLISPFIDQRWNAASILMVAVMAFIFVMIGGGIVRAAHSVSREARREAGLSPRTEDNTKSSRASDGGER